MKALWRAAFITVLPFLLVGLQLNNTRSEGSTQPAWNPQAAAKYLDERSDNWLKWSGAARGQGTACVACHSTLSIGLARAALGTTLGEKVAGTVEMKLIDNVKK